MYAVLGKVQFELITYFNGYEYRGGAQFAEHGLIDRKPRLQWTGDALDEVRIVLSFHHLFCDPEAELARLIQLLRTHEAAALVLGNGAFKGYFVLTELTATTRHTDRIGTLLGLEAAITLREFTGDPAKPLQKPAAVPGIPTDAITEQNAAPLVATASPLGDALRTVAIYGTQARATLKTASGLINFALTLASNPAAALTQLPGILDGLGRTLTPLSAMTPLLTDLTGVIAEAGPIASGVAQTAALVTDVSAVMAGATVGDIATRLDVAGRAIATASAALATTNGPLATLAGWVVTRVW